MGTLYLIPSLGAGCSAKTNFCTPKSLYVKVCNYRSEGSVTKSELFAEMDGVSETTQDEVLAAFEHCQSAPNCDHGTRLFQRHCSLVVPGHVNELVRRFVADWPT
jgi:hypothetical protein